MNGASKPRCPQFRKFSGLNRRVPPPLPLTIKWPENGVPSSSTLPWRLWSIWNEELGKNHLIKSRNPLSMFKKDFTTLFFNLLRRFNTEFTYDPELSDVYVVEIEGIRSSLDTHKVFSVRLKNFQSVQYQSDDERWSLEMNGDLDILLSPALVQSPKDQILIIIGGLINFPEKSIRLNDPTVLTQTQIVHFINNGNCWPDKFCSPYGCAVDMNKTQMVYFTYFESDEDTNVRGTVLKTEPYSFQSTFLSFVQDANRNAQLESPSRYNRQNASVTIQEKSAEIKRKKVISASLRQKGRLLNLEIRPNGTEGIKCTTTEKSISRSDRWPLIELKRITELEKGVKGNLNVNAATSLTRQCSPESTSTASAIRSRANAKTPPLIRQSLPARPSADPAPICMRPGPEPLSSMTDALTPLTRQSVLLPDALTPLNTSSLERAPAGPAASASTSRMRRSPVRRDLRPSFEKYSIASGLFDNDGTDVESCDEDGGQTMSREVDSEEAVREVQFLEEVTSDQRIFSMKCWILRVDFLVNNCMAVRVADGTQLAFPVIRQMNRDETDPRLTVDILLRNMKNYEDLVQQLANLEYDSRRWVFPNLRLELGATDGNENELVFYPVADHLLQEYTDVDKFSGHRGPPSPVERSRPADDPVPQALRRSPRKLVTSTPFAVPSTSSLSHPIKRASSCSSPMTPSTTPKKHKSPSVSPVISLKHKTSKRLADGNVGPTSPAETMASSSADSFESTLMEQDWLKNLDLEMEMNTTPSRPGNSERYTRAGNTGVQRPIQHVVFTDGEEEIVSSSPRNTNSIPPTPPTPSPLPRRNLRPRKN